MAEKSMEVHPGVFVSSVTTDERSATVVPRFDATMTGHRLIAKLILVHSRIGGH